MFAFQFSNYDNPALDAEAATLLHQGLDAYSRKRVPGIWKMVDRLDARAARRSQEEPQQWFRIYSIFLLALGIFILVPGLVKPEMQILIWVGGIAIFGGVSGLCSYSIRKKILRDQKTPKIPASCRKGAKVLLEKRRAFDYAKTPVKASFDEAGMAICVGEDRALMPYGKMTAIFETEHLWLLAYDGGKENLLLQKKDLSSGDANAFSPYILQKICENT